MDNPKLSPSQKIVTGLVSDSTAARMEAESRTWIIECPKCGYKRSVWDAGGVRYKSAGTSYRFMRCPNCGKSSWNKVYKGAAPPVTDTADVSPSLDTLPTLVTGTRTRAPRWALWALVIGVPVLFAIGLFILIFTLVISLTQPMADAGDAFMMALKSSNYDKAYALCSSDLQTLVGGASGLSLKVQDAHPSSWSWNNRSIRNGIGELDGTVTYTNGKTGRVTLFLTQAGNDWKITDFEMSPT